MFPNGNSKKEKVKKTLAVLNEKLFHQALVGSQDHLVQPHLLFQKLM